MTHLRSISSGLAIVCVVLFVHGCKKKEPVAGSRVLEAQGSPENWRRSLLPVPACLPSCQESDKEILIKQSEIEPKIIAEIASAKNSVEFSMFTFSRRPIFNALVDAANRGVKVRGVMDTAQFKTTAAFCTLQGCVFTQGIMTTEEYAKADLPQRAELLKNEESYKTGTNTDRLVHLFYKHPSDSAVKMPPGKRKLVHNKFVLVDGARLLSGSGNWSSTAISVNLENLNAFDAAVEDDKPIVSAFGCAFNAMWMADGNQMAAEMKRCQNDDRGIYFSPALDSTKDGIPARLIASIDSAATSIKVSMHHLVYEPVFDALLRAKQRRVAIQVIADDDDCNHTDTPKMKALHEAGISFRYVPTSCAIFQLAHNKYGIFDDAYVINGSGNWSVAGLKRSYENFVFYRDERVASFVEHFAKQWAVAQERSACMCNKSEKSCQERYCMQTLTEE